MNEQLRWLLETTLQQMKCNMPSLPEDELERLAKLELKERMKHNVSKADLDTLQCGI